MTRILGAILAGGRSSRFGSDKALATLDGRALIDRVIEALALQVDALVVVGRTHPGIACIPDRPAPDMGPLGGIAAALHHATVHGFAQVLTVPCDAPFLPAGLRGQLSAAPVAYLADLPVVGWWPASAGAMLDTLLAGGGSRSVRAFADRIGATGMAAPSEIANINTPDDLALLAKRDIAGE